MNRLTEVLVLKSKTTLSSPYVFIFRSGVCTTETRAQAPGTFGYDHTKYRPPRGGTVPESIPMDEFGQRRNTGDIISQEPTRSPLPSPLPDANPLLPNASRIESPLPFSQYGADVDTVPQIRVTRPSNEAPKTEITVEEDPAPGCCKCLIM